MHFVRTIGGCSVFVTQFANCGCLKQCWPIFELCLLLQFLRSSNTDTEEHVKYDLLTKFSLWTSNRNTQVVPTFLRDNFHHPIGFPPLTITHDPLNWSYFRLVTIVSIWFAVAVVSDFCSCLFLWLYRKLLLWKCPVLWVSFDVPQQRANSGILSIQQVAVILAAITCSTRIGR